MRWVISRVRPVRTSHSAPRVPGRSPPPVGCAFDRQAGFSNIGGQHRFAFALRRGRNRLTLLGKR